MALGRRSGLVVSMLTLYSDDPSLNPAKDYSFMKKVGLKRKKINNNRPWLGI